MFKKTPLPVLAKYCIGFAFSIVLTLLAYGAVVYSLASGVLLILLLGFLALIQAVVQLVYFLHLRVNSNSRWQLATFLSMLVILVIIVAGSLWIMYHLDYNMMHITTEEMNKHLDKEIGF